MGLPPGSASGPGSPPPKTPLETLQGPGAQRGHLRSGEEARLQSPPRPPRPRRAEHPDPGLGAGPHWGERAKGRGGGWRAKSLRGRLPAFSVGLCPLPRAPVTPRSLPIRSRSSAGLRRAGRGQESMEPALRGNLCGDSAAVTARPLLWHARRASVGRRRTGARSAAVLGAWVWSPAGGTRGSAYGTARSLTLKRGKQAQSPEEMGKVTLRQRLAGMEGVGARVSPGPLENSARSLAHCESTEWRRCCHHSWILLLIPALSPRPRGSLRGSCQSLLGPEGLP